MIDEERLAQRLRDELAAVPVPRSVTTPPRRKVSPRRGVWVAAVASLAASVAAVLVGVTLWPGSTQDAAAPNGGLPWQTRDGEMLVRCGSSGTPFAPSIVDEGGLDLTAGERSGVDSALDRLRDGAGIDAPKALQETEGKVGWVAVARGTSPDRVLTVLLPETKGGSVRLATAQLVELDDSLGSLRTGSWGGGCGAEPAPNGAGVWANVVAAAVPDPSADTIRVELSETECSSGDLDKRLGEPYLVETEEAVTVYWPAQAVSGGALCMGHPTVKRTVTLARPLGDRELLDGSRYPARRVQ